MTILKIITYAFIVIDISILAKDIIRSEDEMYLGADEMDLVIDMLLKNEMHEYTDSAEKNNDEESPVEPVYSDGVWKCGQCDDLDESKLVYTETYDVETNYDDSENTVNLQIGLALKKTSCAIVKSSLMSDLGSIRRVSGDCANGVTLSVSGGGSYVVNVYEDRI